VVDLGIRGAGPLDGGTESDDEAFADLTARFKTDSLWWSPEQALPVPSQRLVPALLPEPAPKTDPESLLEPSPKRSFATTTRTLRDALAPQPVPILLITIAVLVLAAIILPLTWSSGPTTTPAQQAASFARQLNLVRADLPTGWHADTSGVGPLAGFLTPNASSGPPSAQESQQAAGVASQFEQCLGITPSQDRVFGPATATPVAQVASAAFLAPADAGNETGSMVSVYGSATSVTDDLFLAASQKYPNCFGSAIGTLFVQGIEASKSGVSPSAPQVQPLALAQQKGTTTEGETITIPVAAGGHNFSIEVGVVLMGAGKAEVTLFTYSAQSGFPAALRATLAQDLATKLAASAKG
jgi:hypothetical protein